MSRRGLSALLLTLTLTLAGASARGILDAQRARARLSEVQSESARRDALLQLRRALGADPTEGDAVEEALWLIAMDQLSRGATSEASETLWRLRGVIRATQVGATPRSSRARHVDRQLSALSWRERGVSLQNYSAREIARQVRFEVLLTRDERRPLSYSLLTMGALIWALCSVVAFSLSAFDSALQLRQPAARFWGCSALCAFALWVAALGFLP
ncbi:MAG: hypothetical protein VYD19_09505 [Myxococcota bacterium]|nr:hypothetical protein [Myxococcota bacterium]